MTQTENIPRAKPDLSRDRKGQIPSRKQIVIWISNSDCRKGKFIQIDFYLFYSYLNTKIEIRGFKVKEELRHQLTCPYFLLVAGKRFSEDARATARAPLQPLTVCLSVGLSRAISTCETLVAAHSWSARLCGARGSNVRLSGCLCPESHLKAHFLLLTA